MAATSFFQRQAHARRNTLLLVGLFTLAVLLIALSVCLVGYLVTRSPSTGLAFPDWLLSRHGVITAATVVFLLVLGSALRWLDLAGGGERVARMVNARPLDPASQDPDERRLRNIVEEMAIASGVPVPGLYVMDQETGINAFVAGYSPGEAVMVVTRGALDKLSRDELQGVVGHEFSHILNGDMRLNVRLIALLAGILTIGQIGFFLLRSLGGRRTPGASRGRGNGQAVLAIVGLALAVIGYVGVFCGRLIQAAVSRQREMLADASSVQFTRNPEGIGGALYKIGQHGGFLESTSHASDMNHLCIGESTRMVFSRLLGSHPPIETRIQAIQPGLLARLRSRAREQTPPAPEPSGPAPAADASPLTRAGSGTMAMAGASTGNRPVASARVGAVSPENEAYATALLRGLPASFRDLLYTRTGAVQLCYALLTRDLDDTGREQRLARAPQRPVLRPRPELISRLLPVLREQGDALRLPTLELAMPALRQLDAEEKAALVRESEQLVRADGRVSLFEFALLSFLQRHLAADAGRAVTVRFRRYHPILDDLRRLLSLMARAGAGGDASVLFREAMAGFHGHQPDSRTILERVTIAELKHSLTRLNQLSALLKPAILDACEHCVRHDGKVDVSEYELLRLVADQLDCPMPPLRG